MRSDHESIDRPQVHEILEDPRGHGEDLQEPWSVTQPGPSPRWDRRFVGTALVAAGLAAGWLWSDLGHPPAPPGSSHTVAAGPRLTGNGDIAVAVDGLVALVDPRTGDRTSVGDVPWAGAVPGFQDLSWSPDGRRLAIVDGTAASVLDLDDGSNQVLGASRDPGTNLVVWTSDGRYDQWGSEVVEQIRAAEGFESIESVSWSPDRTRLAFIAHGGGVGLYVCDADGSDLHRLGTEASDKELGPSQVAWSPDGRRLAFLEVRLPDDLGPLQVSLNLVDPAGDGLIELADAGVAMRSRSPSVQPRLAWSPDSGEIALLANFAQSSAGWSLSVVTTSGEVRRLLDGSISSWAIAWQPVQ